MNYSTAFEAASFPYIVPPSVFIAGGAVPPSEKVVMGFIGVGSMDGGHLRTFLGYDTICHLDDIAIKLGRKLRWNPKEEEFINEEQVNRMLSRPMQSPWRL